MIKTLPPQLTLASSRADLVLVRFCAMRAILRGLALFFLAVSFCPSCGAEDHPPPLSQEQIEHINAQIKQHREDRVAGRTPPLTETEKKEVNDLLKGMHDTFAASQKMLLYQIDHERLAAEARTFAATNGWGRSAPNQTGQAYTGE